MTKLRHEPIYPKYRHNSRPTPSETLMICDNCGFSEWYMYRSLKICGCNHRMRYGTSEEKIQAERILLASEYSWVRDSVHPNSPARKNEKS